MARHLLDQVGSQTLARLASDRGGAPAVTPAAEDAVLRRRRPWRRWLPYFFFALGLFALGGMALGLTALADDGWSWSDAVQLALMAILVMGVVTQARTMLRPTRVGRWFSARMSRAATMTIPPRASAYALDAVTAEDLTAVRPANAPPRRRVGALRRTTSRWFDRIAVVVVVILAVSAFLGVLFILGLVLYTAGPGDSSVWLTAPFTGLTGFATWQVVGSARRMSFRGRPFALLSRAFRDSVRVWGSGSVASKVALTTTATASVAGAAVVPALVQRDTQLDIFLIDQATNGVYRIDLSTDIGRRAQVNDLDAVSAIALTTNPAAVTLADGKKLPKWSLVVVLEGAAQGGQGIFAFRPGARTPTQVSRIEPALPGAIFTGGPGVLYAVQPNGSFWHVAMLTGAATKVAQLSLAPGPMTYESDTRSIVMVSGDEVVRFEPASGSIIATSPNRLADGERACGVADGPGELLFISVRDDPEIRVVRVKSRSIEVIRPTGEFAAAPCQLTVALRR